MSNMLKILEKAVIGSCPFFRKNQPALEKAPVGV